MSATDFGFRTVSAQEKTSLVRGVFDAVASRYDLMNDAMSLGMHRWWKREFAANVDMRPDMRCLDVAGGTGDIAFRLLEQGAGNVSVCDINRTMLEEGRKRADDRNMLSRVQWLCGNAESLPLPENRFNLYTIAFGIRNVTHIDKALSEAYRVLAPGGRFLCLEFSHVTSEAFAALYDTYSFNVIPRIGRRLAGNEEAYRYLVESIRRFPTQEDFAQAMQTAGFSEVRYRNLTGGIVAIHSGYKI